MAGLRRAFQGNRSVDDGFVEDTAQEAVMKILGALEWISRRQWLPDLVTRDCVAHGLDGAAAEAMEGRVAR